MKTDIRTRRRALLTSAAAPAIALALWAGSAAAQEPAKTFSIAPQPLADALLQLSRQADVDIVASTNLTKGRVAPKVDGQMTTADAMGALLAGSGLIAAPSGAGYVITRASDPQSGSAAGDGADAGTVQALIVTAQKREENIQDVPIAMSAFTQEDLTRSQVAGGPDLMTQVPNFTFTKTNFSGYSIQIRGIGTQAISATTDAAVAVAENNTSFVRNRFFEQEFYDLQRVEVLRGPQGTLYGRNATAGVVNIITAKPKFAYEARTSLDIGNYKSHRLEGMINIPLVEDKVAVRLAGAWTKREGYDTNQLTHNQIDGRDLWSTRLSLRIAPTDKLEANLIWEHFQEDDDRLRSGKQLCNRAIVTEVGGIPVGYYDTFPIGVNLGIWNGPQGQFNQGCSPASLYSPDSFQAPAGISMPFYLPLVGVGLPAALNDPYISTVQSRDLRVIESTLDPQYRAKSDIGELQLHYDLGDNLTLTSETAHSADRLFSMEDYNRFATAPGAFYDVPAYWGYGVRGQTVLQNGFFCDPQLGCANRVVTADISTANSRQFSEELRLASDYDGPMNFSLGANFLRYDTEDKYYVFINTITLFEAMKGYGSSPYLPGVTDNTDCLRHGMDPGDPAGVRRFWECNYIDPNPIGSLNDLGHNYFLSRNPYKLISYAAFGEVYYNITANLKLTAGMRWTVDKKEAPIMPSWILASETVGNPVKEVIRRTWKEPTGRVTLDWKPDLAITDETLLYASFAHGYKAGGANPPRAGVVCYYCYNDGGVGLVSATHPQEFSPEFVNAYELGSKNTLLGGNLTLNGDAFYYDYTGYQISQIADRAAVNMNFDAKVWGTEIEADWRPRENLRFGFKGGYENTRVANGMRAVDTMDRTAGHKDWMVVRPFPSFPSNCILPAELWTYSGTLQVVGNVGGGLAGPCELAYADNFDPVTYLPYVPNPTVAGQGSVFGPGPHDFGDYPGFNPATAPNHGEGFYKDLSGNELPNAPHFTATVTADYTLPLPNDWLMTLHGDFYYQAEAWTRIFNTPGYDKLKAYNNVNLAAIFSNEDVGWKVMAYVKNVLDKDNITGAFLNSDDTGLTTNVFLNEPRLYGLRVTKDWTGSGWWTGANPNHQGPYPFTVEVGGQVQRHDAPYETLGQQTAAALAPAFDPTQTQHHHLDRGDGREIKLVYRPEGSPWQIAGRLRYGKTNSDTARLHQDKPAGPLQCGLDTTQPWPYGARARAICFSDYVFVFNGTVIDVYEPGWTIAGTDWSDGSAHSREEHLIADFDVGRDVGLGLVGGKAALSLGLRYADMESETSVAISGLPDMMVPEGWYWQNSTTLHRYDAQISSERHFKGAGPSLNVEFTKQLWGNDASGHLDVETTVGGAVLFGRQVLELTGFEQSGYWSGGYNSPRTFTQVRPTSRDARRSSSATVPTLNVALGLSYQIQRLKLSTGYQWERYYNVLDAGYQAHKSYDRTIDGPYFKIAVGFGG